MLTPSILPCDPAVARFPSTPPKLQSPKCILQTAFFRSTPRTRFGSTWAAGCSRRACCSGCASRAARCAAGRARFALSKARGCSNSCRTRPADTPHMYVLRDPESPTSAKTYPTILAKPCQVYSVVASPFFGSEAPSRAGLLRGEVAVAFTCAPADRWVWGPVCDPGHQLRRARGLWEAPAPTAASGRPRPVLQVRDRTYKSKHSPKQHREALVAAALEVVEALQREGPTEEEVETVRWG